MKDRITNPCSEYLNEKRLMAEAKTPFEKAGHGNNACQLGIGVLSTHKEIKDKFNKVHNEYKKLVVPDEKYGIEDSIKPANTVKIDGVKGSCFADYNQFPEFSKNNENLAYRKYLNKLKAVLSDIDCLLFQTKELKWKESVFKSEVKAPKTKEEYDADKR